MSANGHKPQGRRYWRFVLVSSSIVAGDYFLDLGEQMTYPFALARAQDYGCESPCGSSLSRETCAQAHTVRGCKVAREGGAPDYRN